MEGCHTKEESMCCSNHSRRTNVGVQPVKLRDAIHALRTHDLNIDHQAEASSQLLKRGSP
eukprot:6486834-Amphidinium_carterae.1